MTKKKITFIVALALILLVFMAGTGFTQGSTANKEMNKVTIKGKIDYNRSFGGYYISAENPPSEIFIVNQNKNILESLKKGGKALTIKGHYTIGADHFMIEKINGKKYPPDTSK